MRETKERHTDRECDRQTNRQTEIERGNNANIEILK